MTTYERLRLEIGDGRKVSALVTRPTKCTGILVLAHGAGAGMDHPFMENLAGELAAVGMATFRYQFPYMEEGRRVPDGPALLKTTVTAAVRAAARATAGVPLLAGGKSMGGRMTSQAAAERPLDGVIGLVFFGFPLHPPNRPATKRADHLARVTVPMLFLQGTRDAFADFDLLRPICKKLGSRVTLHPVENADHSFHVLKTSGRSDTAVLRELAETTMSWSEEIEEKS